MSNDKNHILIVDDSPDDIHFLIPALKEDYAVLVATDGEKALAIALREPRPDVILMDVEMPVMNGYETCQRLKENPLTRDIDVIFISAHDTTEEKLAGYDAGGSDYLIKPVQPKELLQKIELSINDRAARLVNMEQQNMAMQTAMTAISTAGELGVVIDFMRRSFSITSIPELASLIVEATSSYELDSSVQIRTTDEVINASSRLPIPPLEEELLSRLKDADRIMEKGSRLILNFSAITQLIKNSPEDEDKRGRLRDHLAMLLEGAEARVKALNLEEQVASVVIEVNKSLQEIEGMQKQQKQSAMNIMDEVMRNIEASFLNCGLTEDQENLLLNVVQKGVEKSLENFEQGLNIDKKLHSIINQLTGI